MLELVLSEAEPLLLDGDQLLLVGEVVLGGDQVLAQHVLLQRPPLQPRILDLNSFYKNTRNQFEL